MMQQALDHPVTMEDFANEPLHKLRQRALLAGVNVFRETERLRVLRAGNAGGDDILAAESAKRSATHQFHLAIHRVSRFEITVADDDDDDDDVIRAAITISQIELLQRMLADPRTDPVAHDDNNAIRLARKAGDTDVV